MRQRKIKNLQEKIDVFSDYIICEPKEHRGELNRFFPADQPLYLEIGCGKGQFITRCARRYPESNFIAVEGHQSVALRALEKAGFRSACMEAVIAAFEKTLSMGK